MHEPLGSWLDALERRHLADLRFAEVTRALRALSADYVERRGRVRRAALDGRGKRAAFALFYGPLHFHVVERIARALDVRRAAAGHVVDLGCGTGAAGAALALASGAASITGIDRHPWAIEEAAWTYNHFGLRHRVTRDEVPRALRARTRPGDAARRRAVLLAAYTANELSDVERGGVLPLLLERAASGAAVLIVEPISRAVAPWWTDWAAAFERAGGRADEWRFTDPLPPRLREFDRAAGLDHREQKARSLWITHAHA